MRFTVLELQTHFSQNILFICCNIFSEIISYLFDLKHFSLAFNNALSFLLPVFKMGLTILVALPVSIFRAKLWKIVVKYGIVMFFNFWVFLKMSIVEVATLSRLVLIKSTRFLQRQYLSIRTMFLIKHFLSTQSLL